MKRFRKFIVVVIFSVIGLCVALVAISALGNLPLPNYSGVVEVLSAADKARLAETRRLIQELGENVWPGWGQTDFPMIVYNEEFAFLVGYPNPPDGWVKVPAGVENGGGWELVAEDTFTGQGYYRQRLSGVTPEAFTVMVGERWVCSLPTFDWMQIGLIQTIRNDLPSFLRPIFPYRLFVGQLVSGDDQYISLNAHECFHAYQGIVTAEKLAAAENANMQYASQYPWTDGALQSDWQAELKLLTDALRTDDPAQSMELARSFLTVRSARRTSGVLSAELIAFEQKREWLEGLARYAELEIWRLASVKDYLPIPETGDLLQFDQYRGFERRWTNELAQIQMMADDEGDGRFYYSGMAQAYLLDRLSPGWKTSAFDENIWLDDLLQAVVDNHK